MITGTDLVNYSSSSANKVIGLVGKFDCPDGFKPIRLQKSCHTCSRYVDDGDFFNAVYLGHNAALLLSEEEFSTCPVSYRMNLDRFILMSLPSKRI